MFISTPCIVGNIKSDLRMGGQQSVRATHFQRPSDSATPEEEPQDEPTEEHFISISNKMVERLVEDATLGGGEGSAMELPRHTRGDYKEKIFMEKLKCLDDSHSERTGYGVHLSLELYSLTIPDMNSLVKRIDCRTANMVSVEPICADFKEKVIECYNTYDLPEDNIKCWDTVGEFKACVAAAGKSRLRERTVREEKELARRTRHMQLARQNELRDLGPRPREESTPA